MAIEEAQVSRFFYPALTFNNNMISYDQENKDGHLNGFILKAIQAYARSYLRNLLELSEKCPVVKKYCYLHHSEFDAFWDMQIENNVIANELGIEVFRDILPLDNMHSLDLIKACYWFDRGDHLRAVSHGSYHSGCVLLNAFITHQSELSFLALEAYLLRLAEIHRTPGQILIARLYLHVQNYSQCLDRLERARMQLAESHREIGNTGCTPQEIARLLDDLQTSATSAMYKCSTQNVGA